MNGRLTSNQLTQKIFLDVFVGSLKTENLQRNKLRLKYRNAGKMRARLLDFLSFGRIVQNQILSNKARELVLLARAC